MVAHEKYDAKMADVKHYASMLGCDGSESCHNTNIPFSRAFVCSHCGRSYVKEPCDVNPFDFCPGCRRRVEKI